MKLRNFELTRAEGSTALNKVFFASVDVETGFLFWKKRQRRQIRREYGGLWHFVDTGEFTPGHQADTLARAWKAQTGQEA